MSPEKLKSHSFSIANLKVGDSFLGCKHCWFQFPIDVATRPMCPTCGSWMFIYTVTEDDV